MRATPPPSAGGNAPLPAELSPEQVVRYSRAILVHPFGGRGQRRLLAARVRVLGEGLAAEVATLYLAAAGIGRVVPFSAPAEGVARLRRHAAACNPDSRVGADRDGASPGGGKVDLRGAPDDPVLAFEAGARAALDALLTVAGGRAPAGGS